MFTVYARILEKTDCTCFTVIKCTCPAPMFGAGMRDSFHVPYGVMSYDAVKVGGMYALDMDYFCNICDMRLIGKQQWK